MEKFRHPENHTLLRTGIIILESNPWNNFYIIEINVEICPAMTPLAHIIERQCLLRKTWHTIYSGAQIG